MKLRLHWLRRIALALGYCAPWCFLTGCALPTGEFSLAALSSSPPSSARPAADDSPADSVAESLATAREMEAHGDDLAAIEQYERVRAQAPKRQGIAARLAALYDRQGQQERAATEYRRALDEAEDDAELWNDYSYFLFQRGAFDEAETAARRALKIEPQHKRSWVNLGLILAQRERYDEAYESFARAVGEATAHNNLGIILARQGKLDEARRELALAQQLDPTLKQPATVLKRLSDEYAEAVREADAHDSRAAGRAPSHGATSAERRAPRAQLVAESRQVFVNESGANVDLNPRRNVRDDESRPIVVSDDASSSRVPSANDDHDRAATARSEPKRQQRTSKDDVS